MSTLWLWRFYSPPSPPPTRTTLQYVDINCWIGVLFTLTAILTSSGMLFKRRPNVKTTTLQSFTYTLPSQNILESPRLVGLGPVPLNGLMIVEVSHPSEKAGGPSGKQSVAWVTSVNQLKNIVRHLSSVTVMERVQMGFVTEQCVDPK